MTIAPPRRPAPKRLFIKSYGCQMNVYDAERMGESLAPLGYTAADGPEDADLVILNTCHIREKAAEKVFSELGRIRALKEAKAEAGERMIVAVAGCVAQAQGEEIRRRAPIVDVVAGPQAYHKLPQMVAEAHRAAGAPLEVDFTPDAKFDALPARTGDGRTQAFLTVQEGCDKFCSFCVVPYTRGPEYSRPVEQILEEARALADLGARELTLLGQNVNAYAGAGPDGAVWGLARLIRGLAAAPGLEDLARIRFTTSHPRDMDDALIAAFADEPKLMPYLHLPVQSGSDRILRAMNRGHDAARYLDVVDRLRAARPDVAVSGDFIVGFPGESDAEFEATLALARAVGYAQAYSFKYSPRPGTPAASLAGAVDPDVAADRLARLQAVLQESQLAFNAACVGRVLPVLIEGPGGRTGQVRGRSPYLQAVNVDGDAARRGDIVPVAITEARPNSLAGRADGGERGAAA